MLWECPGCCQADICTQQNKSVQWCCLWTRNTPASRTLSELVHPADVAAAISGARNPHKREAASPTVALTSPYTTVAVQVDTFPFKYCVAR